MIGKLFVSVKRNRCDYLDAMKPCAEPARSPKAKNSKKSPPKPIEVAGACTEERTGQMQVAPMEALDASEVAALWSGAEDEAGKIKTRKTSKARRKSSTPRKVVFPSDKEAPLESLPRQRKSQRIRTATRAVETAPVKKSVKTRSMQHSASNSARTARVSTNAKTGKSKRVTGKKSVVGQGKTVKRKGQVPSEQALTGEAKKDQKSAADRDEETDRAPERVPLREESQSSEEEKDSANEKVSSPPAKKKIIHKKRPCEVCGRCYNTFYLKVHMRKHTGEKPFACKECSRSFSTDSLLRTHVQRYHGNTDELHCNVCKKVFASKGSLKIHRQIHSDEKPYKCHLCDKEFKQPGVLNEHLKTHNNDFPFICEVCGKRFKSKRSVFRHKESTHDGIKNLYLCTSCGKIFHDKSSLWRHQKRHEQGYTKHICEVCGKQFHERKVLSTHMLIHENKKPYQCEVCNKQFRHYSVLKRHMCCHTGVKPFKCDSCSRQFIHRVYMLRHKCSQKNNEITNGASADPPPSYDDSSSVLVEHVHLNTDAQLAVNPKDVVVFVPDLLTVDTVSLPPLLANPGQDPTQMHLPQHSQPVQAQLQTLIPLQQQEIHAETVVIYPVDGVDVWNT